MEGLYMDRILKEIRNRWAHSHTTKADIQRIIRAKNSGDWRAVYKSRLYTQFGPEYCDLLEIIEEEVTAA
jgi:hypothetical protein